MLFGQSQMDVWMDNEEIQMYVFLIGFFFP
jgi:hypothetical protein